MWLVTSMRLSCCILALLSRVAWAAPAGQAESFVEAAGPLAPLKGTMLSPGPAKAPVVLIIPGSGPTDRDGNNSRGLKASSYRLLAEGLAADGITSVRIDKRGMYASGAAVADANAVTIADYADDVHAWTAAIERETGAPCVWLLGHSEGGLVALVAARQAQDVCGLILVSAAGRPLAQILREQLGANPANAPLLDQAFAAIDALQAGNKVDAANLPAALQPLFRPQVQAFLIDEFSYDPAQLLADYRKPVLILQGQRDIQVGEQDARRLQEANGKATLVLLPDVNHVLKTVSSADRAANVATYSDPAFPLAPKIVDSIGNFIRQVK
jgi:pimeloyl-ACP methyl ester carboxylesterase